MNKIVQAWNWLKQKWNISSDRQMAVIFIVFAITGSFAAFSRKLIFKTLNIPTLSPKILDVIFHIVAIYVVYQVVLFILGHVFGQGKFFRWFLAKMNRRFLPKSKK